MAVRLFLPLVASLALLCAGCASGPRPTARQAEAREAFESRIDRFGTPDWVGYNIKNGLRTLTMPNSIRRELSGDTLASMADDPDHVPFEDVNRYAFYYVATKQQVKFDGTKAAAREPMDAATAKSLAEAEKSIAESKQVLQRAIADFKKKQAASK